MNNAANKIYEIARAAGLDHSQAEAVVFESFAALAEGTGQQDAANKLDAMKEAREPKTFKNKNWTRRNYECTNKVACVAVVAPDENWTPADASILDGLTKLYIEGLGADSVAFYGYL